jgi:hypothetical protein
LLLRAVVIDSHGHAQKTSVRTIPGRDITANRVFVAVFGTSVARGSCGRQFKLVPPISDGGAAHYSGGDCAEFTALYV